MNAKELKELLDAGTFIVPTLIFFGSDVLIAAEDGVFKIPINNFNDAVRFGGKVWLYSLTGVLLGKILNSKFYKEVWFSHYQGKLILGDFTIEIDLDELKILTQLALKRQFWHESCLIISGSKAEY